MASLIPLFCVLAFLLVAGIAVAVLQHRYEERKEREAAESRAKTLEREVDLVRSR